MNKILITIDLKRKGSRVYICDKYFSRDENREQVTKKKHRLSFHYDKIHQNNIFMAGVAKLFDGHILNKEKEEIDLNDDKYKGKIFGFYFSAHWYVSFHL